MSGHSIVFLISIVIVWVLNSRSLSSRWFIILLIGCFVNDFFAGLSSTQLLVPASSRIEEIALVVMGYSSLMFALAYSDRFSRFTLSITGLILGIAPLVIALLLASNTIVYQNRYIGIWDSVYTAAAILILLLSTVWRPSPTQFPYRGYLSIVIAPLTAINWWDKQAVWRGLPPLDERIYPYAVYVAFLFLVAVTFYRGLFGSRISQGERRELRYSYRMITGGMEQVIKLYRDRTNELLRLTEQARQLQVHHEDQVVLELMDKEATRMFELTDRIEHKLSIHTYEPTTAFVIDFLEGSLSPFKRQLEQRGIKLDVRCDGQQQVILDVIHMQELMANLIRNAIEAMPKGGALTLECKVYEDWAWFKVSDTGFGIAKRSQSRIFDPFYSTKRTESNFGLGLFYCHIVAQEHGGRIAVSSNRGSGTVFTVVIPQRGVAVHA